MRLFVWSVICNKGKTVLVEATFLCERLLLTLLFLQVTVFCRVAEDVTYCVKAILMIECTEVLSAPVEYPAECYSNINGELSCDFYDYL
jgi:hypothetical protein